jgi:hypothetical protein
MELLKTKGALDMILASATVRCDFSSTQIIDENKSGL